MLSGPVLLDTVNLLYFHCRFIFAEIVFPEQLPLLLGLLDYKKNVVAIMHANLQL